MIIKKYGSYVLSVIFAIIYLTGIGSFDFDILSILAQAIGVLLLPAIISGLIVSLSKEKRNYGTVLAYTTAICCCIGLLGHFANK